MWREPTSGQPGGRAFCGLVVLQWSGDDGVSDPDAAAAAAFSARTSRSRTKRKVYPWPLLIPLRRLAWAMPLLSTWKGLFDEQLWQPVRA
jgi:hypothetical protein